MFISKTEKEELRISVRTVQQQNKELQNLIAELNKRLDNLSAYAERKRRHVEELQAAIKETVDAVAPWGYKKDGTPKKKPGRHMPLIAKGATV